MYFDKYCNQSNIIISSDVEKRIILNNLIAMIDVSNEEKRIIENTIFYREELMSTGIGLGVAIPHARLENINDIQIFVCVLKKECKDYESIDNLPVTTVFLIILPKEKHKEYIQILSAIVKDIKNNNLVADIHNADNETEIYERLMKI